MSGSRSTHLSVEEFEGTSTARQAATKAIEGYGTGDVASVDVAPLEFPDNVDTFDVGISLERREP